MGEFSVISIIDELDRSGKLKVLFKKGLLPSKILYYREIYQYVNAKVAAGVSRITAITWAEETFDCSRKTVYNALNSFR